MLDSFGRDAMRCRQKLPLDGPSARATTCGRHTVRANVLVPSKEQHYTTTLAHWHTPCVRVAFASIATAPKRAGSGRHMRERPGAGSPAGGTRSVGFGIVLIVELERMRVLFDRCVSRAVTLYAGPCLGSKHFAARGNNASLREER
uniref:Uncharacterized protein n=1 Tax=Anopheles merus TaxID=30066 RepID=A0A182URR7_ANOME